MRFVIPVNHDWNLRLRLEHRFDIDQASTVSIYKEGRIGEYATG
jgi:hypothetical protein